jgi:hypothetical protein
LCGENRKSSLISEEIFFSKIKAFEKIDDFFKGLFANGGEKLFCERYRLPVEHVSGFDSLFRRKLGCSHFSAFGRPDFAHNQSSP